MTKSVIVTLFMLALAATISAQPLPQYTLQQYTLCPAGTISLASLNTWLQQNGGACSTGYLGNGAVFNLYYPVNAWLTKFTGPAGTTAIKMSDVFIQIGALVGYSPETWLAITTPRFEKSMPAPFAYSFQFDLLIEGPFQFNQIQGDRFRTCPNIGMFYAAATFGDGAGVNWSAFSDDGFGGSHQGIVGTGAYTTKTHVVFHSGGYNAVGCTNTSGTYEMFLYKSTAQQ